jgi:hypothetical protein
LRAQKRRPALGTVTIEGRVEPDAEELIVGERREHGCLGGPLVYDVPTFRLRLADDRIVTIEPGPDPTVDKAWRLPSPKPPALTLQHPQPLVPAHTGVGTDYALRGQLRVSGVLAASEAHYASPPGSSVMIDVV